MRELTVLLGFAFVAGCAGGDVGQVADSAGGETVPAADSSMAGPASQGTTEFSEFGDRMGRIPILEYHVIGDSASGMFTITRELFRKNLEMLYERGYRPITVAQLIDRDFSAVPKGMSPVVFTFDDASPSQFSYVERNEQLEIDPKSAVGMWQAFARERPDWKGKATFCLLPAADNGFELCNHTLWHAQLSKYPDAFVQEQIARAQVAIDSAVPGYRVRTFAFPQGLWPKNKALAWRGSWTDPKSGTTTTYNHDTVLEVAGGPVRSPFDPEFDPKRLTRVIVYGKELEKVLDQLESSKTRFIWDGGSPARTRAEN